MNDAPGGRRNWNFEFELWEHQGTPLTVGALRLALTQADDDLPVTVAFHDGEHVHELEAVELGPVGDGPRPDGLVLTVIAG